MIREFLKQKDLTHSAGSWPELKEKRLLPALKSGSVTIEELVTLLSEVEEYGHAHTFLYQCPKADALALTDQTTVRALAKKHGLTESIGSGQVLNQPTAPTVAAIRFEEEPRGKSLVFKIVEKRFEHKFLQEITEGNRYRMEWEIHEARAINIVRLFSFGLLEIRIASHSSKKYDADIKRMLSALQPFIPFDKFKEVSLKKAKIELWSKPEKYSDKICFSNFTGRGGDGGTINAASGTEEGDLLANSKVSKFLGDFVKSADAYCEHSSLYWLPKEGGLPSTKIHVILPSLRNELAVPAHCSKADYEHVLNEIRALSS